MSENEITATIFGMIGSFCIVGYWLFFMIDYLDNKND